MESAKQSGRDQEWLWLHQGVDIWLIRENLALSLEERIAQHQKTLDFIDELNQIGRKHRERPSSPFQGINP